MVWRFGLIIGQTLADPDNCLFAAQKWRGQPLKSMVRRDSRGLGPHPAN
jgi:hypothetical protein